MSTDEIFSKIYSLYNSSYSKGSDSNAHEVVDVILSEFSEILNDKNHINNHSAWFGLACAQLHSQSVTFRVYRTMRMIITEIEPIRFSENMDKDHLSRELKMKVLNDFLIQLEKEYSKAVTYGLKTNATETCEQI